MTNPGHTPGWLRVADHELQRLAASKSARLLLLWIPLVVFLLLAFIYQAGAIRKTPVAIYDQDHSTLSRMLVRMVGASPDMKVTWYLSSSDSIETFFLNRPEKAVYVIPSGFEHDILKGEQAGFRVLTNSSNIIYGNILNRDAMLIGVTLSTGISIQKLMAGGLSPEKAFDLSMPLSVNAKPLFNPIYNYLYYLVPGLMTVLLQMIMFFVATRSLNGELSAGTWNRVKDLSGNSPMNIMLGKAVVMTMMGMAIAMYIAWIYLIFGIPFKDREMELILLFAVFILTNVFLGMMLSATIEDEILSLDVAFFYNSPAFVFSGFTFPMFGMPFFNSLYGQFIPYTHFLHAFFKVYQIGTPLPYISGELWVLTLFMAVGALTTWLALYLRMKGEKVSVNPKILTVNG